MRTPDEAKASEGGNPTDLLTRTQAKETGFTQVITTSISGEEFTTDATDVALDSLRRQIRAELHAQRCLDHDHSELRLWNDARELDRRMADAGHHPTHPTTWGTNPTRLAYRNARAAAKSVAVIDDQGSGDT